MVGRGVRGSIRRGRGCRGLGRGVRGGGCRSRVCSRRWRFFRGRSRLHLRHFLAHHPPLCLLYFLISSP